MNHRGLRLAVALTTTAALSASLPACKKNELPPPPAGSVASAMKPPSLAPGAATATTPAVALPHEIGAAVEKRLYALAERFFDDAYFRYRPSEATTAGFHQYDDKLEDVSKAAIAARVATLGQFKGQLLALPFASLSPRAKSDFELLLSNIEATMLDLVHIRMWSKNPDSYSTLVSQSAFTLISRTFAPPEQRLKSLIAREKAVPKLFSEARANLVNPPRIYCDVALEQLPGIVRFFEKDVPLAFKSVKDAALLAEFAKTNAAVIAELRAYEAWIKRDLLPSAKGNFRLGEDLFQRKLLHEELVDVPLAELLKIGYADLRKNQQRFKDIAAQIDKTKTWEKVLLDITKDHPGAKNLLQATRDLLVGLKKFIEDKKLCTIPSTVLPRVEETPAFMRALTSASMDTPGPYEKKATEAFFNITLPEPEWTAQQVEEHMAGYSRGTIMSTAIHEAYPGHYTQFLWVQKIESKVRKLLGASTNSEGWAHYTEDMMFDEGYGGGDPKLRLGQIQDALLRNARYVVGIEMHTGQMTYEQGIEFFVKEGFQSRVNATRETKRGTSDPTYLYYTLGKLQILKLRDDYKKMKGAAFTLGDFHDRFLAEGYPPIKLVRRALLGNDGPLL